MNISTNPRDQLLQSFEGLALTELKMNSIEGLIIESVKSFFKLEDKSDIRGYSHEVASTTFKKAHYRSTMLGKFFHLDSLLELLNEMELERSVSSLKLVMSHLEVNKEHKPSSKITKALAPIVLPTVTAELLYSIVDEHEVILNIDKILHAQMNLVSPDELNNPTERVTFHHYVTEILNMALNHSTGLSEEVRYNIIDKYNAHIESMYRKLIKAT